MNPRLLILTLAIALSTAPACGEEDDIVNGNGDNEPGGPCVEIYEEPVLQIESVVDEATSDPLETVFLQDILLNGGTGFLGNEPPGISEDPDEDRLICTLPCGFGNEGGTWTFAVSAEGYETKSVSIDASYAVFEGGCPSTYDEGTVVQLELAAQ